MLCLLDDGTQLKSLTRYRFVPALIMECMNKTRITKSDLSDAARQMTHVIVAERPRRTTKKLRQTALDVEQKPRCLDAAECQHETPYPVKSDTMLGVSYDKPFYGI